MGIDIHHENPELWEGRYVSEYTFREKISNELLDETIVIIFAEVSSFHKAKKDDCITEQDKMLYVLKNMGMELETIAKATGLDLKVIEGL